MSKDMYEVLSEERKKLQESGDMPDWYSTGGWQLFKERYLYQAKNPREQYKRIADTAAQYVQGKLEHPEGKDWGDAFFDLLWSGNLSASTPILANMGTKRGLPVSCSGQYIEDSIDGIYSARRETAILTKHGFGTSGYFNVRGRGSSISVGGVAEGVLPVFDSFVEDMKYVSQGSARRGAFAGYIEIDHTDFYELCAHIEQNPEDANIGWVVSSEFIEKLKQGDEDSIKRYQKSLRTKMVTGKGYYFFKDKANEARPQMYKDLDLSIEASNLCVAPETKVLTRSGYTPIIDLEDESIDIWNGEEWSEVVVRKTGENQKILKVTTDCGYELECTPHHKFYVSIRSESSGNTKVHEKRAKDLVKGDKLIKSEFPIITGHKEMKYPYANGFYCGDGCLTPVGKRIYLYHGKRALRDKLKIPFKNWFVQENQNREYGHSDYLLDKFFVPNCNYNVKSRLDWFAGLCDSDGTLTRNGNTQSIQIGSINRDFLLETQLMLQTLGVSSKVTKAKEAGVTMMPKNDGSGELGEYRTKEAYRLLVAQTGICTMTDLGFKCYRLDISDHRPNRECTRFTKIESVIDEGRIDDTYCFTEHKRGMGVFNGILTGQCSEIMLHSSSEYTYTCVLSSMNLSRYDFWKDTNAVFEATVFLDCVAEDFIQKGSKIKGLEKAVSFTKKGRALGLGTCGLHTLFQKRGLPFEGFEAHMLNTEVFKHIRAESEVASKYMAEHLGEPEWCKGYGARNTHCRAVAPTKSTALIMGGISEGINPDPAMTYTQTTSAGEVDRVNPVLLELMKEKGAYTKEHIQEIVDAQGSVQGVSWLSEEEKLVFKTAFEIDQNAIIRLASQRQKDIDQGQSLNFFFSSEESEEVISDITQKVFTDVNILGIYYYYSKRGVVSSKGECLACQ